jgi:hypothetical protein
VTPEQIAAIISDFTIGDNNAAKKAGMVDNDDRAFFMLHRRAVALGLYAGDMDGFLDDVKIADLREAQAAAAADMAPLSQDKPERT